MEAIVRDVQLVFTFLLQLFSKEEWIALFVAWWLGVAITEGIKRSVREIILASSKLENCLAFEKLQPILPLAAVVITGTTTYVLWPTPPVAMFDSPVVASALNGFSAPIIYRVFVAALRLRGCDWLAAAITGDRRRNGGTPPPGIPERRRQNLKEEKQK